jgi:hypothetical protein
MKNPVTGKNLNILNVQNVLNQQRKDRTTVPSSKDSSMYASFSAANISQTKKGGILTGEGSPSMQKRQAYYSEIQSETGVQVGSKDVENKSQVYTDPLYAS